MHRTYRFALLTVLSLPATRAAAQICSGNPVLASTHFAINISRDKFAQQYTGEIRYGYLGVFAAAVGGMRIWNDNNLDAESDALGLTVGFQYPHRGEYRLQLCPVASFSMLMGPSHTLGGLWEYGEKSFSGGVSAGYLVARSKTWQVIPSAALMLGTTDPKLTTEFGGNRASYQDFCCGRRSTSTLWVGVGLGFGPQFTAVPSIAVPLGAVGETTYGVRVAFRVRQ